MLKHGELLRRFAHLSLVLIAVTSVIVGCTPITPSLQESPLSQQDNRDSRLLVENDEDGDWQYYVDDVFGISFEYPSSWSIRENIYPEESLRELEIASSLGYIAIEEQAQIEELTPRQWFEQNRANYSELMTEVTETEVQGRPTLIVGQPGTCETAPLLLAIISKSNRILLVSHYELASRPSAPEFGHLLETLSFEASPGRTSLPPVYFEFPQPPRDFVCP